MPPHEGMSHLQEYDLKNSNIENIGSKVDHLVKYDSSRTEPAWQSIDISQPGLHIWRVEDFEVVPWPQKAYGSFCEGDSYVVLHAYRKEREDRISYDIHFWLGSQTSQDEMGVAAYKTVELDEYLHGAAAQYRSLEKAPSPPFLSLFPRLTILRGGHKSGFNHVIVDSSSSDARALTEQPRLFLVSQQDAIGASAAGSALKQTTVREIEPSSSQLCEDDCFILVTQHKIAVLQGNKSSPMEKARASQVANDMAQQLGDGSHTVEVTDIRHHAGLP